VAIYKLIANGSFGPDEIAVMKAAYEAALAELDVTEQNGPITEPCFFTIPAARSKNSKPHLIPLPRQAARRPPGRRASTARADRRSSRSRNSSRQRRRTRRLLRHSWRYKFDPWMIRGRPQPAIRLSRKDWLFRADRAVLCPVRGAGCASGSCPAGFFAEVGLRWWRRWSPHNRRRSR
jgi:hypothetical protein